VTFDLVCLLWFALGAVGVTYWWLDVFKPHLRSKRGIRR